MAPRILLITTMKWPTSAKLAAAFAAVGAQVHALYPSGHVKSRSRFVAGHHIYRRLFPLTSLVAAIEQSNPDLIVPCDDRAVRWLIALHRRGAFVSLIERSLGRVEHYPGLSARNAFMAEARALGILAPPTIPLANECELDAGLSQLGLPAVVKTDGNWGGDGVVIARTRDQARATYRRLSTTPSRPRSLARAILRRDAHFLHDIVSPPRATMSLQQFVPGKPATSAVACWNGRVLASIHMEVLETLHATGPASVMRRVDCPEMEEAAVRLVERFGLSGLHGVDFILDPEGRAHLLEMNPRATQASPLALGPGHDLVAALTACIAPSVRGARPQVTENPVVALFPQEWRRNPKSGWLRTAYLDVPWDDPDVLRACLEPGQPEPVRERQAVTPKTLPMAAKDAGPARPH